MAHTLISPRQLNTRELFSVQQILLSRGFEVLQIDTVDKLLVVEENLNDEVWETLYNIYLDTKLRTELKEHLYSGKQIESKFGKKLVSHPKFVKKYYRFDNTFEWFAGELMIRKFAALSAAFGVTVKNIQRNSTGTEAGDFDSLVVLRDTKLAYFECKAGGFDGQSISKCYERMLALNCEYSILFCVENIKEENLIWESNQFKIPTINWHCLSKISIKGLEHDCIYQINNCYLVDMSGDIENKIRTVLRVNSAKINSLHNAISPGDDDYIQLGYNYNKLEEHYYS